MPAGVLQLLLIVCVLSAGCSSFSRRSRTDVEPPPGPPRLSKKEFASRVEALSRFATAVHLELEGEGEEATEQYLKAAAADPENENLVLDVARRLIQEQKSAEAISFLEERRDDWKDSGEIHGLLALAYHQAGQTNAAIELGELALKKAPQNLAPYQHLAQLYLQTGRTNEVVKLLDRAALQTDAPVEFHLTMAEFMARLQIQQVLPLEEMRPRILAAVDAAAVQRPENPLFRQRLADFYLMYGEIASA